VSLPVVLVAFTVNSDVPVVVGVPEIVPLESVKPVGNVPLSRLHVTGASPVAVKVWLYAVPAVPFGNDVVVIVGAVPVPPLDAIVIDSGFVLLPVALAALTLNSDVPAVDGVPEIVPLVSVKPLGNVPVSMLHVMGVSPVAVKVWLYAVPTVPPGSDAVIIVGAVPVPPLDAIVIESCFVLLPVALVALTVKLKALAVVGFPEITPAVESVKPVGNVPVVMLHVMGVSPVAVKDWLYAVPTVPPGNDAVVIAGAVPLPPSGGQAVNASVANASSTTVSLSVFFIDNSFFSLNFHPC
jgi:hypothetical protein